MSAYVVVVQLADESSYAEQRDRLAERIEEQGSKYLVRGAPFQVAEGSLEPRRVAVIEYESIEGVQEMIESAEYAELREIRAQSDAFVSVVVVDGA